ncbi:hypothetical protein [Fortiea contorta]|uniref:hypothetical protein n=1 Tax=Fortiea contorta TaxID=1892405 RepID=UPI000344CF39|nr:hypothetical protein [Fortiea contorta]
MQHLRQLLEIQNSELAKLLKYSLHGLEAALTQARTASPTDPGAKICDQILQELHQILQPTSLAPTNHRQELKLNHLRTAFDSDPELSLYLGNSSLQSQTDSNLWNEVQRKLLRVPEDTAILWRNRALELAQAAGAIENQTHVHPLPFIRDELIYPGLSGTIQAPGLCLSRQALLDAEIFSTRASEDLNLLAGFLLLWIKLIEIDPDLHHTLKSVFSFDVMALHSQPEQKTQYIDAFINRFWRVQKADENADPLLTLRAWIDIDEAIHSLVFIPPAERYSWWGKLQQESRRILKKVADRAISFDNNVRIRQLSGLYADICHLTKDDLQLDCGGTPGEVLTCIRVYSQINQEELPGRVLFRSLR